MGNTKISGSEKEIMNVIWKSGKALCVNDVFACLENSAWKYTTVATFLTRLVKKGFLTCKKEGNQNYYAASLSKESYLSEETEEFINDVYDGNAAGLIACFAKDRISKQDYDELMEIIKKYEKN